MCRVVSYQSMSDYAIRSRKHRCIHHSRAGEHGSGDLSGFNPIAAYLELLIVAPNELEVSAGQLTNEISRTVQAPRFRVERSRCDHKPLAGQSSVLTIPPSDAWPANK